VGNPSTSDGCRTCIEEDAKLDAERQQALRELELADYYVKRARERLDDLDNRIAYRHEVQCRDHKEARAARGVKP
jgi:hypothetical protein